LFDDLERKRDIAEFLELTEEGEGVRIFIGSENKLFFTYGFLFGRKSLYER
jgi:heat-inducible transcriptional repressor